MTSYDFRHENSRVVLSHMGGDSYSLHNLWTDPSSRGAGGAKVVMRKAIDFADQHGYVLVLVVGMYGAYEPNMLDNAQLEMFYSKFGFVKVNLGRPAYMHRNPREKNTPHSESITTPSAI